MIIVVERFFEVSVFPIAIFFISIFQFCAILGVTETQQVTQLTRHFLCNAHPTIGG